MVVDFHFHAVDPALVRETGDRNVMHGWGDSSQAAQGQPGNQRGPGLVNGAAAIADMDARGIDRAVLSASMIVQHSGWAPPQAQADYERRANDHIATRVAEFPGRFVGLATLPMKDADLALRELERVVAAGFRGINLPARVEDDYLGAPRFHPLWEAIQGHRLVTFIHPDGARDPWFQQYALWNSIGQPIEEVKVLSSLILEGVLERYPNLKIVVSHGGGYLPHYVSRLDRNVSNMPESVRNLTRRPSEYLQDFYFDTCVYDVSVLEALVRCHGADRLVLGSDYPFGDPDPVAFVRGAGNISEAEFSGIAGSTAERLLGLAATR